MTPLFVSCAQAISLVPGRVGVYLRRAFYRLTLDHCAMDCTISFGAFFSRRSARVHSGVYIGAYAIIGSVCLERDCLVGSRASLLSGGQLHSFRNGKWGPTDFSRETQIHIGEGAWLGEGVIVMADVGRGAMVTAGSVVSSAVRPEIVVAGNPARFVRALNLPEANSGELDLSMRTLSPVKEQ
jgi:virginiamycin A acetyltransferase